MRMMKCAVIGCVLLAIVMSNAEEAKSSQNYSPLTSSKDNNQQNKRAAIYGSSGTLNSGFKPITASYPSVNSYVGNTQFASAPSNVYSKPQYSPYVTSNDIKFSSYQSPSYSSYSQVSYPQSYQNFQPLAFAATQPAHISYIQPPHNYAYPSITHGSQIYAHQAPFNHFAYNQPINPVVHASPIATFANSYQTSANTFYVNPQQIHKIPIYNQQPQTFNAVSYQPTNYRQHQVKPTPSQIITSKPVALQSPIPLSSSISHVEHNHGAVSYAQISQSNEGKPSVASLVATQTPQQVYYHQQPQAIYNGDYSKHYQYAAVPIGSNYYPSQGAVHYGSHLPFAQISKVPFAPPTAASTLIPSIASVQQKVAFH